MPINRWDHDGTTFRVWSDDVVIFETPLAVSSGPPSSAMVIDPISGLPAIYAMGSLSGDVGGLPAAADGDILYYQDGAWHLLAHGLPADVLTMVNNGLGVLLPSWQPVPATTTTTTAISGSFGSGGGGKLPAGIPGAIIYFDGTAWVTLEPPKKRGYFLKSVDIASAYAAIVPDWVSGLPDDNAVIGGICRRCAEHLIEAYEIVSEIIRTVISGAVGLATTLLKNPLTEMLVKLFELGDELAAGIFDIFTTIMTTLIDLALAYEFGPIAPQGRDGVVRALYDASNVRSLTPTTWTMDANLQNEWINQLARAQLTTAQSQILEKLIGYYQTTTWNLWGAQGKVEPSDLVPLLTYRA